MEEDSMFRTVFRSSLLLAVVCVIGLSTAALVAGPDTAVLSEQTAQAEIDKAGKSPWIACPWPPCMMPCLYPPEPEVLCKVGNQVVVTSFACCCCGSGTAKYKPL
jgi:hypothetical protein